MTDEVYTVLDYIDNIKVHGDVFKEPHNEYYALICLKDGLDFYIGRQQIVTKLLSSN